MFSGKEIGRCLLLHTRETVFRKVCPWADFHMFPKLTEAADAGTAKAHAHVLPNVPGCSAALKKGCF
jgi:hypothetical protein